ncbi:DUF4012 domain-containing protein [Candidatus Uhrbacteria bacterium]|nr:DUF4012 domain-containing protein [Candidatus Uhrbacteria bacterium]
MSEKQTNFLTCPAFEELPPPSENQVESLPETKPHEPQKTEKPKTKNPIRHFRFGRWITVVILAILVTVAIPPGIALAQAGIAARQMKDALNRAKEHGANLQLDLVLTDLSEARQKAGEVRDALRRVGFWRDAPWVGTQLRGVEDAAAAGLGTLEGAEDIVTAFQVITDAIQGGTEATGDVNTDIAPNKRFSDITREEKRAMLAKFNDALPRLRIARDKIDTALVLWERVPQEKLAAPLRQALKPLADNLPVLKKTLDEAIPMLEVAVPLAGYPYPVRYLVFLQNADEMRPSGGFIGNVGTMTMDAGELTEFGFQDVYAIDNPAVPKWKEVPPEPISKHLGVPAWFMRDANWSPDFPTSAERVLDFYIREKAAAGNPEKSPPSTVIALGPGLFKSLLRITGPITVRGKVYTAQNFFDEIQYEVEMGFHQKGIPTEERKEIVSEIGQKMVERLKVLPASRWPELVDLVTLALERKQIMAYSRNPDILSILDTRSWTGRVKPTNGDYVQVIDANLAALKTDGVMDKKITYSLDARDPSKPIATVTLIYQNTNRTITWRYTRYRSYTRVYVPEGSRLISAQGAMAGDKQNNGKVDVMKELGKTVFGAFWSIEPGRTGTLKFTYELPPNTIPSCGEYHLDFPKQSGADETDIAIDLQFAKPIKKASPPEDQSKWGDARYQVNSDSTTDQSFTISGASCDQ